MERRESELSGLSAAERNAIEDLAPDSSTSHHEYVDIPWGEDGGTEGGTEWEDIDETDLNMASNIYRSYISTIHGVSYTGKTTNWKDNNVRFEQDQMEWDKHIDVLIREFLTWRRDAVKVDPPDVQTGGNVTLRIIDMFSITARNRCFYVPEWTSEEWPNVVLIRNGLLLNSPLKPQRAFSLSALEAFRCLKNRKPSYSPFAFTKSLCDIHLERWQPIYYRQFTEAYNVYLRILRGVEKLVARGLGRDDPDWRLKHSCPPCQYKLEDEEPVPFDFLMSIDGGSSLKRFATTTSTETGSKARTFDSNYFISRDDVNTLANAGAQRTGRTADDGDVEMESGEENGPDNDIIKAAQIDPTSSQVDTLNQIVSVCVERWKANADERKKGMFGCFDESGIFISVCRHGMILIVADMVASGELAKYPLAILEKIQAVLPGPKLIGYDIGCAFKKTVANSRIGPSLGNSRFLVPAMHGYAHNRPCQLNHHPTYVSGAGLEDFETCERVFSSSNECAGVIRHANAFHRHQTIDAHFRQWDTEKYANIGKFLKQNYEQALDTIRNFDKAVDQLQRLKQITIEEKDFEMWLKEEEEYLAGLSREPERDTLAVLYVEELDKLAGLKEKHDQSVAYLRRRNADSRTPVAIYRASVAEKSALEEKVEELEGLMELQNRWTPDCKEYKKAKEYVKERQYRLALDHLEKLVVQRLFELQKTHLASTGYKLRTQIAKHLKSRSEAIRTALSKFNNAARSLDAAHTDIKLNDLLGQNFLTEFDLLRSARNDIRSKPWADATTRVVIDHYFKSLRAREEIQRINLEVRRLRTWMRDDEALLQRKIDEIKPTDQSLAYEIQRRLRMVQLTNRWIEETINKLEASNGFTGIRGCGKAHNTPAETQPSNSGNDDDASGLENTNASQSKGDETNSGEGAEEMDDEEVRNTLDQIELLYERLSNLQ